MSTTQVNANEFLDTVFRDGYRVALVLSTASAIVLGGNLTRAQVEDPSSRVSGVFDLGPSDGFRMLFVTEPTPTSPVLRITQLEPVLLASDGITVGGYVERPCLDTADIGLTEGTSTIGATLATAIGNGAANTWRFASDIGTPTVPQTGIEIYSPSALQAHVQFAPAQGARYFRVYLGQTTTTKKVIALFRRIRGDAQGK